MCIYRCNNGSHWNSLLEWHLYFGKYAPSSPGSPLPQGSLPYLSWSYSSHERFCFQQFGKFITVAKLPSVATRHLPRFICSVRRKLRTNGNKWKTIYTIGSHWYRFNYWSLCSLCQFETISSANSLNCPFENVCSLQIRWFSKWNPEAEIQCKSPNWNHSFKLNWFTGSITGTKKMWNILYTHLIMQHEVLFSHTAEENINQDQSIFSMFQMLMTNTGINQQSWSSTTREMRNRKDNDVIQALLGYYLTTLKNNKSLNEAFGILQLHICWLQTEQFYIKPIIKFVKRPMLKSHI